MITNERILEMVDFLIAKYGDQFDDPLVPGFLVESFMVHGFDSEDAQRVTNALITAVRARRTLH